MLFYKLKTPSKGYCGYYAFSLSLIMLMRNNDYILPEAQSLLLLKTIKQEDVQQKTFAEIYSSKFVIRHFSMTQHDFLKCVLSMQTATDFIDLLKAVNDVKTLYALAYIMGVAFAHINCFEKGKVTDLSETAFQCDLNWVIYSDKDPRWRYCYRYNEDENCSTYIFEGTSKGGHLQCLLPMTYDVSILPSTLVDAVYLNDASKEASYYNYILDMKKFFYSHRNTFFHVGVGLATAMGVAAVTDYRSLSLFR